MTQYLLRADIGVRGDTVRQIEIVSGALEERNGGAVVNVMVNNPSTSAMEFQVRTHLVSDTTSRSYKSDLYVPVRVN